MDDQSRRDDDPNRTLPHLAVPAGVTDGPPCAVCGESIPEGEAQSVNGHPTCAPCVTRIHAELAAQRVTGAHLPLAILGGGVGAFASAALWAAIAIATEYEIGYVAVLLGFLSGLGVKLGARTARGPKLQAIASVWAVVGLVAAKYFMVAHLAVSSGFSDSYLDPRVFEVFAEVVRRASSVFDLLWLGLAVYAAWRVPRATPVTFA